MRRNKHIKIVELPKEDPERIAIKLPEPQAIPFELPRREEVSVPRREVIEPRKVER
jgi:hypothetical protein